MTRDKVCNLIYLNSDKYVSIRSLRTLYWKIIIFPLMMVVWGLAAINAVGITLSSLFPLISIAIWSFLYWIFVLIIQSKKTKKTFEIRFLVNGICGVLISLLFWILYGSYNLMNDDPNVGFDFSLWILFFYLIFSTLYIALVVLGVHRDAYKRVREMGKKPLIVAIDVFFASLTPLAAVLGMMTSRLLRSSADVKVQSLVVTADLVVAIFLPSLSHINFVQYFYCKKYNILCDENGNTSSPKLEPQAREKRPRRVHPPKTAKKKIPLPLKILIGILAVPIAFFVVVFIVAIVKVISNRM